MTTRAKRDAVGSTVSKYCKCVVCVEDSFLQIIIMNSRQLVC